MKPRPGVVLLLALLCIVALELSVTGLHFAALQQIRAARSATQALQLRLSAQSAVANAVSALPTEQVFALPIGGSLALPGATGSAPGGVSFSASIERLDSALFLLRAESVSPLRETARAGYLLVLADHTRSLGKAALLSTGQVSLDRGASLTTESAGCDSVAEAPDALQLPAAGWLSVAGDALVSGVVGVRPELEGALLESLLPFSIEQLQAAAVEVTESTLRPEPISLEARCATEVPDNWGEPLASLDTDPCVQWFPVLSRAGDLTLTGGRGQGILYVAGDLVLTGQATFSGLILVGGSLSLTDGASLQGAVLTAGPVIMTDGSIGADRCALSAALNAAQALSGPFRPATRSWIPLF